jgi:hypothetical protein
MNRKVFFFLLSILILADFSAITEENTVYTFGPASGTRLVFTTPQQANDSAIHQLNALVEQLKLMPPAVPVSVIITRNDFSSLPADLRTGYPQGTNRIISLLQDEGSGSVILLEPGPAKTAILENGAGGKTTPKGLFETVYFSLDHARVPVALPNDRMSLFRLGWIPGDPLLGAYLRAGIPAVLIRTDRDITTSLLDCINSERMKTADSADIHYLVWESGTRLFVAGEKILVLGMIIALGSTLLFLFVFSFLLGKKADQHFRDLLHVWWIPFLYLVVNTLFLYAGQAIIAFLFNFRFGTSEAWTLLPALAFVAKLVVAWFFITLVVSLNQLVRLPEDGFIYGYIASIVCLLNIFVFSSLDFSLSLLFLAVYGISFLVYHVRHPVSQIIGILLLVAPFIPYFQALFAGGAESLAPLYRGTGVWNFRIAVFAMPFQLLVSRFFHSIGIFGRKEKIYLPVHLFVVFLFSVACIGYLLFVSAWSVNRPLTIPVRQSLDNNGSHISMNAPVPLRNLLIKQADLSGGGAKNLPQKYVRISSADRTFLARRLVAIQINPVMPVQKIEVLVSAENGLAVNDASVPFELRNGGLEGKFDSEENPVTPWTISFSSDKSVKLKATVRVWTRANPYGLTIQNEGIKTDFLLEIVSVLSLSAPAGQKEQK